MKINIRDSRCILLRDDQSLQGRSLNAVHLYFYVNLIIFPYHDQSQIIDENKYAGLALHFIKRRSIFMGRSQNAVYYFLREFNNLPYHDQSQIIDKNKYMGFTLHFIKRRSIFMGRSQNAVYYFLREFNNLPYHDQSQIIDKNKYMGFTVHFIKRRSIITRTFAKCGILFLR